MSRRFMSLVHRLVDWLRAPADAPGLGRLLMLLATGAAGDTLVALALAGSLFFSVPEAAARGRVALYLALTVAPFAVVAPVLSRALDRRRGSLRAALVVVTLGRALLAWTLATRLESVYLFPLSFCLLVLARAVVVIRGALVPVLVRDERAFVRTNAASSRTAAVAGMAAVPVGLALLRFGGPATELGAAAVVYLAGVAPALRLPSSGKPRQPKERRVARGVARSLSVRQAVVALTSIRFLVGFLVFHLAFALRREDLGSLRLGLLVASAAVGALLGALSTPGLRRRLREEGILVGSLAAAGVAGVLAGRWFSLGAAAVLVLVFGAAAGAAKVAFDAILQRDTPEGARGAAFARFESLQQLAWVLGALVPLGVALPPGAGVAAAGIVANLVAMVIVVGRLRSRSRNRGDGVASTLASDLSGSPPGSSP